MLENIQIDSVIGDLEMEIIKMDASEKLEKVYEVFECNNKIPGIILTKNNIYFRVLSKSRFYKVMSKQFMFDVFAKRPAYFFFDENKSEQQLVLKSHIPILVASTIALQRDNLTRFEPILVEFGQNDYKLLDYFSLLHAENQVHTLTATLLKESNEFKNEVLRIVAHDLKNPIGNIMGSASIICNNANDVAKIKKFGKIIYDSSNIMNNLVDDFLNAALHDATKLEMKFSEFNLTELISEILHLFQFPLSLKKQTVQFEVNRPILVHSDKNKVQEIIENLISNSIKYSPKEKQIVIELKQNNQSILIEVRDEGPGLTQEDKLKIFGKFQKLSAKPTGKESSTGLGLYITKKLTENLNGKIWVESEFGVGSSFFIELPLKQLEYTG